MTVNVAATRLCDCTTMAAAIDHIAPVFSGFEAYYTADLEPVLAALEPRRRKLARDCAVIIGAAVLATIAAGGAVAILFHSVSGVLSVIFIGVMGAVLGLNWRMEDGYTAANGALLGGIARFLKLEHHSDVRRPRSMATFKKYGLVPAYNGMECGDVIEGEWAGAAFSVSEAFLSKRRRGKTGARRVFAGQLFRIARCGGLDQPLVLIKPRGPFSGWRPPFAEARRLEGLTAGLDRRFHVWSAAPDSGRQAAALIVPLAEKLHDAYRKHHLAIGLIGNQLYIAVGNGHRLVPGSMWTPLTSRKRAKRAAVAFKHILDTVEWAAV